jgi:DNA-binding MarR family transcriptional regulator
VTAPSADIGERVRALLLAYERHGSQVRRQLGLAVNEELVLLFLAQGVTAPTELSEAVGMTTAGMTNLLDRLEADGFVRRERHATDGRRVLVTLTKRGFQLHMQLGEVNARLAAVVADHGAVATKHVLRFLEEATSALLESVGADTGER